MVKKNTKKPGRPAKVKAAKKTTKAVVKKPRVYKTTKLAETTTISGLRKNCLKIGDSQYNLYEATTENLNAVTALAGYKQALDSAKVQITYQKNSGKVKKIPFCEE